MFLPIIDNVSSRKTDWVHSCPDCQQEKVITYAQKWNITVGNSSGKCKWCIKGWDKSKKVFKTDNRSLFCFYKNLFNNPSITNEARLKQRNNKLGKVGDKAPNWRGGKTSARVTEMARDQYRQFRKMIMSRDNYTCQLCDIRGGKLEMDHIKEWCNYPELRYEASNCRTLCKECHKKTDNYTYKAITKKVG